MSHNARMKAKAPRAARMRGRIATSTLLILAAAVALGAGLWAGQRWFGAAGSAQPELQRTLTYPTPRQLPPFSLQQSDGTELTLEELSGRWTLVFFGFTHCPDVCPTTLAQLAQAGRQWQDLPPPSQPQVLFVSVDPERDTPGMTGRYAAHFGPDILAATAGHAVLEPFARTLGMVYMQTPLEGGGYTVDHSSSVAVLDPQGQLVAVLRPPFDAAVIAADMRALVEARG